jgi:hypothetical protein
LDCAARFTGESCGVGAVGEAAVGVRFNAAKISFISNGIHLIDPFNGHNNAADFGYKIGVGYGFGHCVKYFPA